MSRRTSHLALALLSWQPPLADRPRPMMPPINIALAAGHYAAARWRMAADEFARLLTKYPRAPAGGRGHVLSRRGLGAVGASGRGRGVASASCCAAGPNAASPGKPCSVKVRRPIWPVTIERPRNRWSRWLKEFPDDPRNAYALVYLAETMLAERGLAGGSRSVRQSVGEVSARPAGDRVSIGPGQSRRSAGRVGEARHRPIANSSPPSAPVRWRTKPDIGWVCLENAGGDYQAAIEALARWSSGRRVKRPVADRQGGHGPGLGALQVGPIRRGRSGFSAPLVEQDAANHGEAQYCLGLVRAGDSRWSEAIGPLEFVLHHADRSGARGASPARPWRFAMPGPSG